jgi:hypothetical protein
VPLEDGVCDCLDALTDDFVEDTRWRNPDMTVDPLCPYWCHGEWEKTMVAFHRTGLSNRPHQNSSTRLISNDFRLGLNQRHNAVRVVELCGQSEPLSENSL